MLLNPAHPIYFFKLRRQRNDDYLKQLWMGIREGRVFTDRQCNDVEEVRLVFMVLAMMDRKGMVGMRRRRISMFYEYTNKAGPRSINGKPCFLSVRCLNSLDVKRLWEIREKVESALQAI